MFFGYTGYRSKGIPMPEKGKSCRKGVKFNVIMSKQSVFSGQIDKKRYLLKYVDILLTLQKTYNYVPCGTRDADEGRINR